MEGLTVKKVAVTTDQNKPTVFHSTGTGSANMLKDIHLENFDIAFGKDMLISNGQVHLAYGRK